MSEFQPNPEGNERQNLEVMLQRQTEYLTAILSPNESEAVLLREGISLEVISDHTRYCVYPALITQNSGGDRFKLHYDMPTVENLIDSFAQTYKVRADELSELYIGTAVAAHILSSRVREQNTLRMGKLMNVLTDISSVCDAVRTSSVVPDDMKHDALHNLMQSSTTRAGNINVLRFAFGVVYPQSADDLLLAIEDRSTSGLNYVQQQFRDGLLTRLSEKESYVEFGAMFKKEAFYSERVFADSTGEFELAACFPMSPNELTNILNICKD